MDRIELSPHAKVNLTLEVGLRMADGYHEIDSIAQIVGISDRLVIDRVGIGLIEVEADAPGVPSGPGNLVHRACEAFFASTGTRGGVRCRLAKGIPTEAGLGGGSSDAAAAIVGLDRLFGTGLPIERLARIAAEVGSDAALFVLGGAVRMRGRGERVEALPDAPALHVVIVKPRVGVSTGWAYAELDKTQRPPFSASDRAEAAIRAGDRGSLVRSLRNDFEIVVWEALSEVALARDTLLSVGAECVMLCGSGSAVLGVFASSDEAASAAERARLEFPSVSATHTLTRDESEVIVE